MAEPQVRILFLAANPNSTSPLDLDGEYEAIENTLLESRLTKQFLLQHRWKLGRDQLLDLFLKYRPHIVHFSGHGTANHLILQDREGNAWPLDRWTAREAFKATNSATRLVILNACYSRDVAEELSEVVDCVIGMSTSVYDASAILFAGALYRRLGDGLSLRESFDQARSQIKLSGRQGAKVPQILTKPGLDPRGIHPIDWLNEVSLDKSPKHAVDQIAELQRHKISPMVTHATGLERPVEIERPAVIDRSSVRKLLDQHFQLDPDFDQFVGEHFSSVKKRFTIGMDRVSKQNLLFDLKAPAVVYAALESHVTAQ